MEKPLKKVDPQLLKMALTPYPKLKAALFPPCTSYGILPPDISLYHLVQVHRMLLSSAFWQNKSKLRSLFSAKAWRVGTICCFLGIPNLELKFIASL